MKNWKTTLRHLNQLYLTCAISTTNRSCTFSSERSEHIKFRKNLGTELNPGQVPEIKDCPEKSRTDDHLSPRLCGGYNYDSTSIQRPFDGHSTEVIKVIMT